MKDNGSTKNRISVPRIVLAAVLIIFAVFQMRTAFPDLTFPLINSYSKPPEQPSANGSPYKFYYEDLSNIEKSAYNMILDKIYEMPEKILVPDLSAEELDNVYSALLSDNPDLFFVGRRCSVTAELWNDFFTTDYIIEKEEYDKYKKELDETCREIIAGLSDVSDPWQTELEIHNFIIDNTSYKLESQQHIYSSSYGCLVNGKAGCEGYSKAAKLLLDSVGIKSYVITGKAKDSEKKLSNHMWNIVNIEDSWYHLDCTWDDPVSSDGKHYRMYSYFNVSDKEISRDHSDYVTKNDCSSSDGNYYSRKGLLFKTYNRNDEEKLKKMIVSEYNSGSLKIQIKFADKVAYDNAHGDLIENTRLGLILRSIKSSDGTSLARKAEGYIENEDQHTLTLLFK